MARMLQALKNLEARAPRPAGSVLAHLAQAPPAKRRDADHHPALPKPEPPDPVLPDPDLSDPEPPAAAPAAPSPVPIRAAPLQPPNAIAELRPSESAAGAAAREPAPLESLVRRTLADPARLPPIRQMADRLLADARQTASRTLLLAGVGTASATHEALLYAGALLAEQTGSVLLVDADSQRRTLSTELRFDSVPGLGELLTNRNSPRPTCQPTSFAGLWLLPAGNGGGTNLSAAGSRLGEMLHELTGDFNLIVLDGGRCADGSVSMLARLCDACYLVVKLGTVEASQAQLALRDLRAAGARVLGCIAT